MESKKPTKEEIERVADEVKIPTATVRWRGFAVTVKNRLSAQEYIGAVEGAARLCTESGVGDYLPELSEFAYYNSVLESFTDLPLPDDVKKRYELVYGTDVVRAVCAKIDGGQLAGLRAAIEEKIGYEAQKDLEALRGQMNELYAQLQNLTGQMNEMLAGTSAKELRELTEALKSGLDEGKIARAVLAARKEGGETAS